MLRKLRFSTRALLLTTAGISIVLALFVGWVHGPVRQGTKDGKMVFDVTGLNAVWLSVKRNDTYNLKRLLLLGSYDVDATFGSWTLLQTAVHARATESAEILLEKGANPNLTRGRVPTPLEMASYRNTYNKTMVSLLKKYGAK